MHVEEFENNLVLMTSIMHYSVINYDLVITF